MTAIVGTINKHGVAIAADSAASIGIGGKYMTGVKKIFPLCNVPNRKAVLAVYGNLELIGTPWELIANEFRHKTLQKTFDTLGELVDAFFSFLKSRDYFSTSDEQKANLIFTVRHFFDMLIEKANNSETDINDVIYAWRLFIWKPKLIGLSEKHGKIAVNIAEEEIKKGCERLRETGANIRYSDEEMMEIVKANLYKNTLPFQTGLIFAGYGEKDMFPRIYAYDTGCVINNTLGKRVNTLVNISKAQPAAICPFAKAEDARTIINGYASNIFGIAKESITKTDKALINSIAQLAEKENNPELARKIREIDIEPYTKRTILVAKNKMETDFTKPMINSMANLEINDLKNLAESMVTVVAMRCKASQQPDVVDTPVNTVVLTKEDAIGL